MGNININNFCDCIHTNSKLETSFNSKPNNDIIFCPFIHNNHYQKNIECIQKNSNDKKNKSKFDFSNIEMNFEYHTSNAVRDTTNKINIPNKSTFNLGSNRNYEDNKILNDINDDINANNNNEKENSNENKDRIISLESENYNNGVKFNIFKNNKENEEEKIITNKNLKTKEISSNSYNSNVKTNIEKPKQTPKNGFNIQIWGKNAYYIGNYKDDIADGIGKLIAGSSKYFGEFKYDQANGFGIFHNEINETIYEGYWLNDSQNDIGIEKWNNESIFYGKYEQGEKNGIGTYIWNDGSRYEGEFRKNQFEGYGIYFYNKNKIYLGEWKNNKKNGYGEFISGDKLYIGYYLNDQKEGFGISYWKKEDKLFIGFWKNNKKNGFGKFFHDKKVKYGIWDNENEKQIIKWFNNDDALNYLNNNNYGIYVNYFEKHKEEILFYLNKVYEEDFIFTNSASKSFLLLNIRN